MFWNIVITHMLAVSSFYLVTGFRLTFNADKSSVTP